jgi:hypothetical protein
MIARIVARAAVGHRSRTGGRPCPGSTALEADALRCTGHHGEEAGRRRPTEIKAEAIKARPAAGFLPGHLFFSKSGKSAGSSS